MAGLKNRVMKKTINKNGEILINLEFRINNTFLAINHNIMTKGQKSVTDYAKAKYWIPYRTHQQIYTKESLNKNNREQNFVMYSYPEVIIVFVIWTCYPY